METFIYILLVILSVLWTGLKMPAAFSEDDFEDEESLVAWKKAAAVIRISDSLFIDAKIEVTSKGNGLLEIPGRKIKVYDAHWDRAVFRNYLLKILFIDFDHDGYRDLIIFGLEDRFGEKWSWAGGKPVLLIYRFDPDKQTFEPMFRTSTEYDF